MSSLSFVYNYDSNCIIANLSRASKKRRTELNSGIVISKKIERN